MNTRFIEVPSDALLGLLRQVGEAVSAKGGSCSQGTQGREVIFDICPPNRQSRVRVFTTITRGASQVRGCGDDAIRLVVGHLWTGDDGKERFGPLAPSRKLLRTAPKGPEDQRLSAFLDRLRGALRDAYGEALRHPTCQCGHLMRLREPKRGQNFQPFYGCTDFPKCKGTKPFRKK